MEHDFTDDGRIYIEREDEEDYIVICPCSTDCGRLNIKAILKVIAEKNPELYMDYVTVDMIKKHTKQQPYQTV